MGQGKWKVIKKTQLLALHWQATECLASTHMGMPCQLLEILQNVICRHGGKSTGPWTQAGRDKLKQLQLKHGKNTKEKRLVAKKRAETGRKLRAVIKQTEMSLIDEDVFDRNWRKDWKL